MIWDILLGRVRKHQFYFHDVVAAYQSIASLGARTTWERHRCHGCGTMVNHQRWALRRFPRHFPARWRCPFEDAPKAGLFEWLRDKINCWGDQTPKVQTFQAKITGDVDAA